MTLSRVLVSALFAFALASCEKAENTPPPAAPPVSASAPLALAPSASAPVPSAAPEAPKSPLVGAWEGRYDAKKGAIVMPPRVKDKAHTSDDGKALIGPGKVTFEISSDGELNGKSEGALGPARLRGKVDLEGELIGAQWYPEDPRSPTAMTGVLTGHLKDGKISSIIRVAGPDAVLVREATLELEPKKP